MKVNCDYQTALTAIEKFKNSQELTKKEYEAIIEILETSKGDLIPTQNELDNQILLCNKLTNELWDRNPDRWKQISDEITVFENKYF